MLPFLPYEFFTCVESHLHKRGVARPHMYFSTGHRKVFPHFLSDVVHDEETQCFLGKGGTVHLLGHWGKGAVYMHFKPDRLDRVRVVTDGAEETFGVSISKELQRRREMAEKRGIVMGRRMKREELVVVGGYDALYRRYEEERDVENWLDVARATTGTTRKVSFSPPRVQPALTNRRIHLQLS